MSLLTSKTQAEDETKEQAYTACWIIHAGKVLQTKGHSKQVTDPKQYNYRHALRTQLVSCSSDAMILFIWPNFKT